MEKSKKKDKMELRKERVQQLCEKLEKEGYCKEDLTISAEMANTTAILTTLLPIGIYIILFNYIAGWEAYININVYLLVISMFISLIVHELIHGLFFGIFAPSHFSAIEFGVLWKSLNPYCYCGEPITKVQYLISVLMPGIILGTCVGAVAIITGSATWLVFSLFSYVGASGDFLVALKIMRFSDNGKKALFVDHPDKPGLLVFSKDLED